MIVMGRRYSGPLCPGQERLNFVHAVAREAGHRLMKSMQKLRTTGRLQRAALAALFGLMGLVHGPVMSVAKAGLASSSVTTAVVPTVHHPHQPPSPAQDVPSAPTCDVVCHGLGCFQSLTSAAQAAPLAQSLAREQLIPAPARVMIPTLPDPADPPPRLQA
jgi:hypothetical protein